MNELVSVVVPAYNAQNTIEKCIASLLAQTYRNIEIIIVVDGASDGTFDVCKKMSEKDNRIKVHYQENQGPSVSRNKGIELSIGEYIAFADADDYVEIDFVQQLLESLKNNNCDISMCAYAFKDNAGNVLHTTKKKYAVMEAKCVLYDMFTPQDASYGGFSWNKLYKASIIKENDVSFPEEYRMFEDIVFNYEYIKHCKLAVFNDKCLYNYVENSFGISKSTADPQKWYSYADAFDVVLNDTKDKRIYNVMLVQKTIHCSTAVRVLFHLGCKDTDGYKKKRNALKKGLVKLVCDKGVSKKKKLGAVLTLVSPNAAYKKWAK